METIRFTAVLYKIQTLASGGGRVALDFASSEIPKLYELLRIADQPGLLLEVSIQEVPIDPRFFASGPPAD